MKPDEWSRQDCKNYKEAQTGEEEARQSGSRNRCAPIETGNLEETSIDHRWKERFRIS